MRNLLAFLSFATLFTGCGLIPVGDRFGDPPSDRMDPAEVASRTPAVAVLYRGHIRPVDEYFPKARWLVPFSGPKESLETAYPRKRAQLAADEWLASAEARRPGEWLLTVECERHDSIGWRIFDAIFFVIDVFVALPPLIESFDHDLVLTLTDGAGEVVATGRSRASDFRVGTFGYFFFRVKYREPQPDLGLATRGLLESLQRRR